MFFSHISEKPTGISSEELNTFIIEAFDSLDKKEKILIIPPDITRFHSRAGEITQQLYRRYQQNVTDIMPALGTHFPLTDEERTTMFADIPKSLFRNHNWREDIVRVGTVPGSFVEEISEGSLSFDWPVEINKLLVEGHHDCIVSVGQVVPHEVIGMANHNKNILVGVGGNESINKSHYVGAVYGVERILGRADNPVRRLYNYAEDHFLHDLPILYILTVLGHNDDTLVVKGVFIGDDQRCFKEAAALSLRENVTFVEKPLTKVVVYLDPKEFKSTWLGNKSIYRTRMAIQDGGELIVLAPGIREFGEDKTNNRIIRTYGYRGRDELLQLVDRNRELQENLGAVSHLIVSSPEKRFTVTYCTEQLTKAEIEAVGFSYADPNVMLNKYNPRSLRPGYNTLSDGEQIYFISNPALGLWTEKDKLYLQ